MHDCRAILLKSFKYKLSWYNKNEQLVTIKMTNEKKDNEVR